MGPPESPTRHCEKQAAGRRKRQPRRPRTRRCLLKGCEQRFHPRQAGQRYCCERCRREARKWSRWKAQQRYRETMAGQQKRRGQSRRYRERVKNRQPPEAEADNQPARVITPQDFFRAHLRPTRVLRRIRAPAAKSFAALLFAGVPASAGAGEGAGAALETGAHLIRAYCSRGRQHLHSRGRCNWNFINWNGAGSTYACAIRRGSGACWHR